MALNAALLVSDGSEDIETASIIDVLSRANIKVSIISVLSSEKGFILAHKHRLCESSLWNKNDGRL
jgi:putative intracellular protease/amidase